MSNVPIVVYESGERLRLIALANAALIGPLALELSRHGQQWTRGVACALGLLCGDDYVNVDALLEVFPIASDSRLRSGRRRGIVIGEVKPLMHDLIIQGAEYLLRETGLACYLDIVKEKARNPDLSWETLKALLGELDSCARPAAPTESSAERLEPPIAVHMQFRNAPTLGMR